MKRALLIALPLPGHDPADTTLLLSLVGGVPLLKRQVRLLQAIGCTDVVVLCAAPAREALMAAMHGRLAPGPGVRFEAVSSAGGGARAALEQGGERALVLSVWDIFERGAVNRVRQLTPAPAGIEITTIPIDGRERPVGLMACGAAAGRELEALLATWPTPDTTAVAVTVRPQARRELAGLVRDAESLGAAAEALWQGCRKPLDGFVSRNLNRHVSLFISRRIAHTRIDPNHISWFNLLLGLVGGVIAAQGGYQAFLVAAILLKANSILDGVDGELARMRIQASLMGEWLDTISDDLSNQAFFIGVAVGAWRMTGDALWLWLGLAAALPMALVAGYYYRWCIQNGRGDILAFQWTFQTETLTAEEKQAAGPLHRVLGFFKTLFRKDTFVMMFLLAAIAGVLPYTFWVVAPAAIATVVMLAGQHVQQKRYEARQAGVSK